MPARVEPAPNLVQPPAAAPLWQRTFDPPELEGGHSFVVQGGLPPIVAATPAR